MSEFLTVSASPHIHTRRTTSWCMRQVIIALIPALVSALAIFGVGTLIVTLTAVLGCVLTEYLITRFMLHRPPTVADGSAILTGLLLACNLPSNLPVWIVLIGCIAAIGIGKMAFGGLGCNIFNPAIFGRVFLLISFPAQMTTWPLPSVNLWNYTDAITGATALGLMRNDATTGATMHDVAGTETTVIDYADYFFGNMAGSMGEVCAVALLLGFAYLLWRKVISWHIPVAIMATAAAIAICFGRDPLTEICSGGLLLGAIFMATDYVTSPMTHRGMIIYGIGIGIITMVIRLWGSYPEGVSFSILMMNGVTPLINRYVKPRRFGEKKEAAS